MPKIVCFDTRYFYELFTSKDEVVAGKLREIDRNCVERHVSVITIHEISKELTELKGRTLANSVIKQIKMKYTIHDVNEEIALRSANLRVHHQIPLADAVIAATAIFIDAPICTDDPHFSDMDACHTFWLK